MWFCCYSFGSQLYAWKNFDCSSLSQWQIPSRLLDRASSFSSFSHSLILPKMLFNTLSLPFSCFDYCFDDGSRGISNPAPSSTRFHCWKIRDVFPQLRTEPSSVQCCPAIQHTSVLHPINPINSVQSWWRGRSASSSNPSFGSPNLSIRDQLQRVWIPAVLSLLSRLLLPISIYPLFDNWFLLCEVPLSYRATIV